MAGSGSAHLRGGEDVVLSVENLVVDFPVDRKRKVSAALKAYAKLVMSADKGAVRDLSLLD